MGRGSDIDTFFRVVCAVPLFCLTEATLGGINLGARGGGVR